MTSVKNPNNIDEWPITLINEKQGKLILEYQNGEIMEYLLVAVLKRPRLKLLTTGNDFIEGSNFIDFGKVYCESHKKNYIYLKNLTDVESDWKIEYVKFTPRKDYGYGTLTNEEKEDIELIDDPEVFKFDFSNGLINGPSGILVNLPLSSLHKVKNENDKKFHPIKIQIIFQVCFYLITLSRKKINFINAGLK